MNDKLKAFIASLAVVILCAVVAIITFSQGVWYGAIPLALGIFFLIRFTIPAWNEYGVRYLAELTKVSFDNLYINHRPPPSASGET